MLNGTGAPADALGHDGDFYLDTVADVLYGPKASGTWPGVGTSLVGPAGPPGSPGKGATVASLAAGDANCPNGGAAITDGSGNTAYTCTGATGPQGPAGSADLQPSAAFGGASALLQGGAGFADVPGSTAQVAPTADSTYLVNANLVALDVSGTSSPITVTCKLQMDGANVTSGLSQATLSVSGGRSLSQLAALSASATYSAPDARLLAARAS